MSATGTWKVITKTPMGEVPSTLELVEEGGALSGRLTDADGTRELSEGSVEGTQLKWKAKVKRPFPMALTFTATVEGDAMTGGAKSAFGTAPFTGQRA